MGTPRRFIALSSALGIVLATVAAGAPPTFQTAQLTTPGTSRTLTLPEPAGSSSVIALGTAVDPQSGKLVEGYAIIHPKKGYHHRPGHGGGPGGGGNGGSACFAYLATGAKWKGVEPWVVNPANTRGLSEAFVFDTLIADIAEWEDAADGAVDGNQGSDILGDGATTTAILTADTSAPDGVNEVLFANVSSPGAIAVTIVWGIFRGPPSGRELVEWDQVYDDVDYDWSADCTAEDCVSPGSQKMDFSNIAEHELGHSVGMGHPDDSCTEETMFRFAGFGETSKRDLNAGDIAGVDGLY